MVDFKNVSLILISKEDVYPKEILDNVLQFPWGEIIILNHSDSCFRKYELFTKAKYEILAYQDDDAICSWKSLMEVSKPDVINVVMKQGHYDAYKYNLDTMGLGWGSVFPKSMLKSLEKYISVYGEDDIFKRETDRIFTYFNYPQNRLVLPIQDLPSAFAPDRMWRQPEHKPSGLLAEERCKEIYENSNTSK